MTTAGKFNKILFLRFLGKRVTASEVINYLTKILDLFQARPSQRT